MLRFHTRKAVRALAILSTLLCFSAPAAASDGSQHPLDPLTAREYRTISRVLTKAGHLGEDTLLPLVQKLRADGILH